MFDRVEITVRAGAGGDGMVCFRREKFVPLGGPDGGDGGNGGNVIFKADSELSDLRHYHYKGIYKAKDGGRGGSKKKHGKNGEDSVLTVPVGTVILPKTQAPGEEAILADLDKDGQQIVVARGGKGGFGNAHYATPVRRAPEIAQKGESGEEFTVILDLRLIADVGIIGYPNVGKSSLLAAASAANPKIADYPFTTREPVLGVVEADGENFVLAEIPGLIVGAHLGKGLGHDFLHHAIRTRIFIHLIDGGSASPVDDMIAVNNELSLYDSSLGRKPQIVAVNKVDLTEVQHRMDAIREAFREAGVAIRFISAGTGEGVPELLREAGQKLREVTAAETTEEPQKVFRPRPKGAALAVRKEGDMFVVEAPGLARMVSGTGEVTPELLLHIKQQLTRLGLDRAMLKAGAHPGDKVRCGEAEWEWMLL